MKELNEYEDWCIHFDMPMDDECLHPLELWDMKRYIHDIDPITEEEIKTLWTKTES